MRTWTSTRGAVRLRRRKRPSRSVVTPARASICAGSRLLAARRGHGDVGAGDGDPGLRVANGAADLGRRQQDVVLDLGDAGFHGDVLPEGHFVAGRQGRHEDAPGGGPHRERVRAEVVGLRGRGAKCSLERRADDGAGNDLLPALDEAVDLHRDEDEGELGRFVRIDVDDLGVPEAAGCGLALDFDGARLDLCKLDDRHGLRANRPGAQVDIPVLRPAGEPRGPDRDVAVRQLDRELHGQPNGPEIRDGEVAEVRDAAGLEHGEGLALAAAGNFDAQLPARRRGGWRSRARRRPPRSGAS